MINLEFAKDGRLRKGTSAALKSVGLRYCPVCKAVKQATEFPVNHTYCTLCKRKNERGKDTSRARQRRRQSKIDAMEMIGGAHCRRCGYSEFLSALHFHHLEHAEKEFDISNRLNRGTSLDEMIDELRKCIVLCGNCHRSLHNGEYQLPADLTR